MVELFCQTGRKRRSNVTRKSNLTTCLRYNALTAFEVIFPLLYMLLLSAFAAFMVLFSKRGGFHHGYISLGDNVATHAGFIYVLLREERHHDVHYDNTWSLWEGFT
jgi:hypothetical protein